MSDSDLLFSTDDAPSPNKDVQAPVLVNARPKWRILIVDDEEQVHKVTSLVLNQCKFDQTSIELVHAYSMAEAKTIMQEQAPFALALVDVVMETDSAGLDLVKYIREELKDTHIRLVLRTGQPGQAPEETVIVKYDINDYKNKTELTSTKLKTLLYSALRSYRDIRTIDSNREGLYKLIQATANIVDSHSLPVFASAVLEEINALLHLGAESICTQSDDLDALAARSKHKAHCYKVLAATGSIKNTIDQKHDLPEEIIEYFDKAKEKNCSYYEDPVYIGYYKTPVAGENLLYVKPNAPLNKSDKHLLSLFMRCVAITHNNLQHKNDIQHNRQEMVYVLSETIERRKPSESSHVRRVSEMAYLLALKAGLPGTLCERLKLAAPLHDIGSIGLDDAVLLKQGKYDADEHQRMEQHTGIGASILLKSNRPILKLAGTIAKQHHERWDGLGYPEKLQGEDIDICARIVALVDVIDALSAKRSYREAFSEDEIKQYLTDNAGKHFDPELVNPCLELLPDFKRIKATHPDSLPKAS